MQLLRVFSLLFVTTAAVLAAPVGEDAPSSAEDTAGHGLADMAREGAHKMADMAHEGLNKMVELAKSAGHKMADMAHTVKEEITGEHGEDHETSQEKSMAGGDGSMEEHMKALVDCATAGNGGCEGGNSKRKRRDTEPRDRQMRDTSDHEHDDTEAHHDMSGLHNDRMSSMDALHPHDGHGRADGLGADHGEPHTDHDNLEHHADHENLDYHGHHDGEDAAAMSEHGSAGLDESDGR